LLPTGIMRMRSRRWTTKTTLSALSVLGFSLGLCCVAAPAVAQEQDSALKPQVMQEPGFVTDVIDAFDDDNGDPFDIKVTLGFRYLSKKARILRESSAFRAGSGATAAGLTTGGFTSRLQNVGEYIETTSTLTPRLDVGVYKDLAVYAKFPIVLANSRRIDPIDGTDANASAAVGGAPGEVLFNLPFEAPDRSGLENVTVGIDFGIFNQARDRTKPTWILGFEARISAGTVMSACNANPGPGEVECAHEGDINRNNTLDGDLLDANGNTLESQAIESRDAGIARGTTGLNIHTLMSKRLKYIEPYGGFDALIEVQQSESGLDVTDVDGTLVNNPPVVGTVMVGMMVHPWENREAFQRITLDLRFQGEYHSEGRDYSELYDALGSSNAASLRNPKWAGYRRNDSFNDPDTDAYSIVDEGSEKIYTTGLAVVEAYGSYRAAGSLTWRAGEYVQLQAGVGLRFDQAHGISHDQPCNPDFKGDPDAAGPCHSETGVVPPPTTGIPNPSYRPTVNAVGRRFYVDESITYEVFASGQVMF
jgi:hypothetical protein